MSTAIASTVIALPLADISEAQRLVALEVQAVRELAVLSEEPGTLLLLDLIEAHQQESTVPLSIVLQISAGRAAAAGLTQRQWMQQLLNRHATHQERVQILWRTLVDMHMNGELPWAA